MHTLLKVAALSILFSALSAANALSPLKVPIGTQPVLKVYPSGDVVGFQCTDHRSNILLELDKLGRRLSNGAGTLIINTGRCFSA